jgi:hypothetical protein
MRVILPIATLGYQCTTFSTFMSLNVSSSAYNAPVNSMMGTLFFAATGFVVANLSIERYMTFVRIKRENWKFWAILAFQTCLVMSCFGIICCRIAIVINSTSFAAKAANTMLASILGLFVILSDFIFNIAMSKTDWEESDFSEINDF